MLNNDQKNQTLISIKPTPVLNTSNFESVFGEMDGKKLLEDEKGHIRSLEFIAFKNTIFEFIKISSIKKNYKIYQIKTSVYRSKKSLYIDSRFVKPHNNNIKIPHLSLDTSKILNKIERCLGIGYLWGGNYKRGIKDLLKYYPPKETISSKLKNKWMLKGLDCSGLLFEATAGFTPRNTDGLLLFGEFLNIEKLTPPEIIKLIKPLDLIIFSGHVIIIKNKNLVIESRECKGVIQTPLLERLEEIIKTKKPVNNILKNTDYFVIKRWINKKIINYS